MISTIAVVYPIAALAFFLWLLSRFIGLTSDVRYLANQARKANGDEAPQTNPRITAVIVAVALLMLVAAVFLPTVTSGMHL